MDQPHVVVIMADQLRADLLGPHTPHLNALLGESTVFHRAYCAAPLCAPARGSFFTGRYPNQTGCLINPWREPDRRFGCVRAGLANLYTLLDGSWDSWHVGKQHFFTEERLDHDPRSRTRWIGTDAEYRAFLREAGQPAPGGPTYRGFMPELVGGRITRPARYSIPATGRYEPGYEYFFDGYFARQALTAIRERDPARPFLLNLMFLAPHPPLQIPEPWYSLVGEVDLPENVGRWSPGQSPLQLYNLPGYLGSRYEREDWREIWRVYAGLVALLDHAIGLVLDELRAAGLYDDALILFTSDHGEMLGSHRLWQKMCMYEEATRVPLAIKLPRGGAAVAESRELVSHIDVLPTLCDFLGVPPPAGLPGVSLRGAIAAGCPLDRAPLFIQFDGNGARGNFQRCLIAGRHKLVVDLFKDETFFELYDVVGDPQEQRNLAWEATGLVRELLAPLLAGMRAGGDLVEVPPGAYERFLRDYPAVA